MSAAARLNRRLGIETSYAGQTAGPKSAPSSTIQGIWKALIPGEEHRDPSALLAALEREESERILDPVIVAEARSRGLHLRFRPPPAAKVLRWEIVTEEGEVRHGDQRISDLPIRRTGSGRAPRAILRIPGRLAYGYHRLRLSWAGPRPGEAGARIILAPPRAYMPDCLCGNRRIWGLASQLYSLRSRHNWGIGDFSDLGDLLERAAGVHAAAVGVNPLHALFEDDPQRASPYSPSSRLFLNPLYLDVSAIPDFAECEAARDLLSRADFRGALASTREAPLVDYPTVQRLKRQSLELLYAHFRAHHLTHEADARGRDFRAYQGESGQALRRFAVFQALREHFALRGQGGAGWRWWPAEFRCPQSAALRRFLGEKAERVEFLEYEQWQADRQLARARARAEAAGMGIGIYRDVAVGFDPTGADAWTNQSCTAMDWSIGAPPDAWNMKGQLWGMPPLNPRALRAEAYQPVIEMLRANMRHAGAVRIDHVLGFKRLFWIPQGAGPAEGAYVGYPLKEMLAVVALESHRNRCLVVGEDLGTVPEGFSDVLQSRGIFSYLVLYFMREKRGSFVRPSSWPRNALAQVSTHDLPTLKGFWTGRDIEVKSKLSLFPTRGAEEEERLKRPAILAKLKAALQREGLNPRRKAVPVEEVHRFLARSRSRIAMVQLEDAIGAVDQVNIPGTIDEHANWRRKLPDDIAEIFARPRVHNLLRAVNEERESRAQPVRSVAKDVRKRAMPAVNATYRLQLNSSFGFEAASALLPYLKDLGISHLYLSPILAAQSGSSHGYDSTSYEGLNPELGPPASFDRLCARLRDLGLGLIVDFVPNHMGIGGARNRWWLEVLEWGAKAPMAPAFEIDWDPPWPELKGKVLLPILAESYEAFLDKGEIRLRFDREGGRFDAWYFDHRLPIRPLDYEEIIAMGLSSARETKSNAAQISLSRLAKEFAGLDEADAASRKRAAELQDSLALLALRSALAGSILDKAAAAFAADAPGGKGIVRLDGLLRRQHYQLAHWRLAASRANYRRFFDIGELIGVRMERRAVFERCHELLGRFIAEGRIDGLRLDHVDGLKDPAGYLRRLRRLISSRWGEGASRFYVAVEKILGAQEELRRDWPVEGTTGYEFIALLNGLFADPAGSGRLQRICESFSGERLSFKSLLREAKAQVIDSSFGADLERLATAFARAAAGAADRPRHGPGEIAAALREIAISFPAYRSYVTARGASREDRALIDRAVAEAALRSGTRLAPVYAFCRQTLKGIAPRRASRVMRTATIDAAMRFQQFSAAVMAKGLEDTTFYRYPRLLSLNEVGGDPGQFSLSIPEVHRCFEQRQRHWPLGMLASATHDTKRGEDSRARLNVLSEIPAQWETTVRRWARRNHWLRQRLNGGMAPRPRDEYFLYQTLVGAWPFVLVDGSKTAEVPQSFVERVKAYFVKALREAKRDTSWLQPSPNYENACVGFVESILDEWQSSLFLGDLTSFVRQIAPFGAMNSLGQVVLKLTAPGVPDIYQGCEHWDLSLVDPDNRRPVDFEFRKHLLSRSGLGRPWAEQRAVVEELLANWPDGRIKVRLIAALLDLRRNLPELFERGRYEPLRVRGPAARHVFAFRRRAGNDSLIVAVARLLARLAEPSLANLPRSDAWQATTIQLPAASRKRGFDIITGRYLEPCGSRLDVGELFETLPLAVLVGHPRVQA